MQKYIALMLAALAAAFMAALSASSVWAHAEYESSTPARDEVVQQPPAQVDVFFSQDVRKLTGRYFVRVFNDQETQVTEGDGTVDDDDRTHISAALPPDLPPGRYIVRWMTTSDEDGDDDDGAFCFYVAVEPTPEQEAECAEFAREAEDTTPAATSGPTETPDFVEITPAEATDTPGDASSDEDDEGLGGAELALIIGGIVGGVAVAAVVVGGVVVWLRRTLE